MTSAGRLLMVALSGSQVGGHAEVRQGQILGAGLFELCAQQPPDTSAGNERDRH
jgi:hypothetical protein